jgi:hypothetical protein
VVVQTSEDWAELSENLTEMAVVEAQKKGQERSLKVRYHPLQHFAPAAADCVHFGFPQKTSLPHP